MSIDPQFRSTADALLARLTVDLRQKLDGVVAELTEAAESEAAVRVTDAQTAAAAELAEALDTARAEHATALEQAQRAAQASRDELEAAHTALESARAEAAAARTDLQAAEKEADTARAEVSTAQAAAQAAREEAGSARTELAQARNDAETTRTDALTARADADAALAQAEATVTAALAQAEAQAEQSRASTLVESAQYARYETADRLSALARAATAMDEATSLSEVLDALASGLSAQARRSLVLVFKGDAARVWRRSGFADAPSEVGDALELDAHDDLRAIVESAAPAYLEGRGEDGPLLGVATLPAGATGLAVPVAIGGQVAALVYADAGDSTDSIAFPGWAELVEVLARHAARCLESLTAMRASGYARPQRPAVVVPMPPHLRVVERPVLDTPVGDAINQAQRVARLLVSEIRLNREEDIRLGRESGDLGERLADEIVRARHQYLARVSEAVPGRDALFEDELIRTLANGNAELLRRPTGS